ncbi:MAG: hypothetical protein IPN19_13650 [Elusimicrobia bacterium]|nr:hypothetical protein [Elusimicrobiota bacterium]
MGASSFFSRPKKSKLYRLGVAVISRLMSVMDRLPLATATLAISMGLTLWVVQMSEPVAGPGGCVHPCGCWRGERRSACFSLW